MIVIQVCIIKVTRFFLILIVLSSALLITACEYNPINDEFFAYDLRGTWETNGISDYSGTLIIDRSTIRITGYAPNNIYELTNGTDKRPFRDFSKGTPLEGYSSEGKLFIYDRGNLQNGIPYSYYPVRN